MSWILQWARSQFRSNEWGLPVRNFGCVTPDKIFRGAQPTERGYAALRAFGIETVVDLRDDASDRGVEARAAGLRWYTLPLSDEEAPSAERVQTWLEWSRNEALMPIFVHCKGGRHRTGGLVAAYRLAFDAYANDQAYEEACRYGFYAELGHEPWKQFILSADGRALRKALS